MLKIQHIAYVGSLLVSGITILDFGGVSDLWQAKVSEQQTSIKEAKRYSEKLRSLETTIMKDWEAAYDDAGNKDRVSLARRLNIADTGLIPKDDVPDVSSKEPVFHEMAGQNYALGLVKVCFGQNSRGYEVSATEINELLDSMYKLESKPGVDFDSFTLTVKSNQLMVNIYDLCMQLKESSL